MVHSHGHAYVVFVIRNVIFAIFFCVNLFGRKIGLEVREIRKHEFSVFITLWERRREVDGSGGRAGGGRAGGDRSG